VSCEGEAGAEGVVTGMRRSLVDVGSWVGSWGSGEGSCVKGRSTNSLDEEAGRVSDSEFGVGGAWIKEGPDFDGPAEENVDLDCRSGTMEGSRLACACCFSFGKEVDLDCGSSTMEGSRLACACCFSSGKEVDKFMSWSSTS